MTTKTSKPEHPLKAVGEFGLISKIQTWFDEPTSDLLGIGDDCTVIPREDDRLDLITTDMLIEETHFLLDKIEPEDLGHKSLAVNLSDIAAMGGTPEYAWLSIGLTEKNDIGWLEQFFSDMKDLAKQHGVRLLGGDTTRSQKHMVINILVSGKTNSPGLKLRSSARVGDIVFVTGMLGDSGAGLQLLLNNQFPGESPAEQKLIKAHNRPDPCVIQGQWLGGQSAVHALIDVSDGIASDAGHIAARSGLGIDLELTKLPVSNELTEISGKYGWSAIDLACSAGEDYVLLGTCSPSEFDGICESYRKAFPDDGPSGGNHPEPDLFPIGYVRKHDEQRPPVRFLQDGSPAPYGSRGFDHFKV